MFSFFQLPTVSRIIINSVEENDADLKLFLERGIPKDTQLNFNEQSRHTLTLSNYIASLLKSLPKIKKTLSIFDCKISSADLNALFPAAKHLDELCIPDNSISVDGPLDFGEEIDYKIKKIWFRSSGARSISFWHTKQAGIEAIISAMGKTKLRQSLQNIYMDDFSLRQEEIEKMVKDAGLDDLDVNIGFQAMNRRMV